MKYYTIEVDDIIMDYLKKRAEPFVDDPNTVLHKLLFGGNEKDNNSRPLIFKPVKSTPKALSQILEVIEEFISNGLSRPEATKVVADRNGTAPQTIIDKYCRQLGKKANEVDLLLREPDLDSFRVILTNKFSSHRDEIETFFNNMNKEGGKMDQSLQHDNYYHRSFGEGNTNTCSNRKKRDTALESALKRVLGERLKDKFGSFSIKGQSQLVFNGAKVLCKFSSFHDDQSRWFWGVSKTYWQDWSPTDYLALIMENASRIGYSFIILNSDEAQTLFNACSESAGEKKINMRIYADDNVVRFQEWKEFDFETRSQSLDLE